MSKVNFKEKMAETKAKNAEKMAQMKDKFQNKVKENNIFDHEVRQRMSEDHSHKSIVNKLHHAYTSGNVKAIDKIIAEIPTSDMVEEIWREAIYNQGGSMAADRISNTLIEGAEYVHDMNKYQRMINPYNKYNLALYIADGNVIDADYIIDDLAEDINICADKFGYEEIYHFEETDENGNPVVITDSQGNPVKTIKRDEEKIVVNAVKETVEDIDKMEIPEEKKAAMKKTEAKRAAEVKQRHANDPAPVVFPTDEEIEAERQAYLAGVGSKKSATKESSSKANTSAGNETVKAAASTSKKKVAKEDLNQVIDPFEIISETIESVNEIASSVEENAKKEAAKSSSNTTGGNKKPVGAKSQRTKTGGTAPAKKSKSAATTA